MKAKLHLCAYMVFVKKRCNVAALFSPKVTSSNSLVFCTAAMGRYDIFTKRDIYKSADIQCIKICINFYISTELWGDIYAPPMSRNWCMDKDLIKCKVS